MLHAIGFAPESALGGNFLATEWADVATAVHVSTYSLKALASGAQPLFGETASIVGLTFDTMAVYEARLVGGAYVGYALVGFLTRDTAELGTRRAVAAANAVAWAVGLVLSTTGQLQGLANATGWTVVVLAAAFTAAWAWSYLAARERGQDAQAMRTKP